MRLAIFCIAFALTGCGKSEPGAKMAARDWRFYFANPSEIEPMQKICREWAASTAPSDAQPAVVTGNCRAAAFAKAQLQLGRSAARP